MIKTIPIIAATDKVPEGMSTSIEGDGMGCHAGGEKMLAAAKASGKSRPTAKHVPSVWIVARGTAHATHCHNFVGLCMLRIRLDFHITLLRC
jgi:hypothetical protein